jgi:DNA-binding NarL/FixJ family response regulator
LSSGTLAVKSTEAEETSAGASERGLRRYLGPGTEERLTLRELQIVTLLEQGLTQKEVAFELALSDSTVRVHLLHARRRNRGRR